MISWAGRGGEAHASRAPFGQCDSALDAKTVPREGGTGASGMTVGHRIFKEMSSRLAFSPSGVTSICLFCRLVHPFTRSTQMDSLPIAPFPPVPSPPRPMYNNSSAQSYGVLSPPSSPLLSS
jgi:hypothetical protein